MKLFKMENSRPKFQTGKKLGSKLWHNPKTLIRLINKAPLSLLLLSVTLASSAPVLVQFPRSATDKVVYSADFNTNFANLSNQIDGLVGSHLVLYVDETNTTAAATTSPIVTFSNPNLDVIRSQISLSNTQNLTLDAASATPSGAFNDTITINESGAYRFVIGTYVCQGDASIGNVQMSVVRNGTIVFGRQMNFSPECTGCLTLYSSLFWANFQAGDQVFLYQDGNDGWIPAAPNPPMWADPTVLPNVAWSPSVNYHSLSSLYVYREY